MSRSEIEELIIDRYEISEFIDLVRLDLATLLSVWDGWCDCPELREDLGLED